MSKLAHKGIQRLPLAIAVIAALQVAPVFAQDQSSTAASSSQATGSTDASKPADKNTDKAKQLEAVG